MTALDVTITRHRFSVDDLYRMVEAGILEEGARVELVDGEIVEMAPIGHDHAVLTGQLTKRLVMACADAAHVWVGNPLRLSCWTELQPDFMVLRGSGEEYRDHRPLPSNAVLVVEVSASSLRYDRKVKLGWYARSGVPEYWIVDVEGRRLEVHTGPSATGFEQCEVVADPQRRTLVALSEVTVDLSGRFGPPPAG